MVQTVRGWKQETQKNKKHEKTRNTKNKQLPKQTKRLPTKTLNYRLRQKH